MKTMLIAARFIPGLLIVTLVSCGGAKSGTGSESDGSSPPASAAAVEAETTAAEIAEASPTDTPAEIKPVSFSGQVAPIFELKCNDCHHPDNAVDVDLTNVFDPEVGLINRPNSWPRSSRPVLVVPGDPDASALVWKVEQSVLELKVDGDPMPWAIPRLTESELAVMRQWIVDGAEDDVVFSQSIRRIYGDGVSLGSRGGKCAYCHYAGADYGPDLTDVFNPETGAVSVASDSGGVRIVRGDPDGSILYLRVKPEPIPQELAPPMPMHYSRLTDSEKQIIRDWISEGALDN